MGRGLNKVMLIGNVGADPEMRSTGSGMRVAKISLATNRTWNDNQGRKQEKTEWHNVTFFDKQADIIDQYVRKGDALYVEGRIEYSQTEDERGNVRYWTNIIGREFQMLGSPNGGGDRQQQPRRQAPPRQQQQAPPQQSQPSRSGPSPFDADDDDLPF